MPRYDQKSSEYNEGYHVFDKIDQYLNFNYDKLTTRDISNLYYGVFDAQKHLRGSSGGFTGFSEFLIFRLLVYTLEKDIKLNFKPEITKDSSHTLTFTCDNKSKFKLTQGIDPHNDKIKIRPDILILKDEIPYSAAEIKVWLTERMTTALTAVERLRSIYEQNPKKCRCALFIFATVDNNKKLLEELETLQNDANKTDT